MRVRTGQPPVTRRTWHVLTVALVAVLLSSARPAVAQVGFSVEARALSRYLFAGLPFSTGWVSQGQAVLTVSNFTFNGYTNYDFDTTEVNELDIWGDYFHTFNDVFGGFVGAGLYHFKHVVETGKFSPTPELYYGLSFFTVLSPTLYVAHDFDLGSGTHAYASVAHEVPVGVVTLTGTGRLAYNAKYWREGSGFSYADLNLAAGVPLGVFTFTPSVAFVGALDKDDFIDVVVWGASLRADF